MDLACSPICAQNDTPTVHKIIHSLYCISLCFVHVIADGSQVHLFTSTQLATEQATPPPRTHGPSTRNKNQTYPPTRDGFQIPKVVVPRSGCSSNHLDSPQICQLLWVLGVRCSKIERLGAGIWGRWLLTQSFISNRPVLPQNGSIHLAKLARCQSYHLDN